MWSFPKMRLVPDGFCKADKCSCNPSIMQNLFKFAFLKTVARLMALLFWVSSGIGNGPKKRVRSGAPMIPDWLEYLLYICNPLGPNTKDLSDHFWVKPPKQTRLGHAGPLAISVEPFPVCVWESHSGTEWSVMKCSVVDCPSSTVTSFWVQKFQFHDTTYSLQLPTVSNYSYAI